MTTRRNFLGAIAGGGLTTAAWPLMAKDLEMPSDGIRMNPETSSLVRLIADTPREKCQEMLAGKLKSGVPYRELLAAAFMFAALRDGHHSLYLVHASHQLSLDLAASDRTFPLFWAVDVMKEHLTRFEKTEVKPLSGRFPSALEAESQFKSAMTEMDKEKAEHAIIALSRNEGPRRAYARLLEYAGRDNFFIGHIPIGIVSAGRVLETIGWQHAEPTLRYIVRDMYRTDHTLKGQPYPHNVERVDKTYDQLPGDWASNASDHQRTIELVNLMRRGKWWTSNDWVAENLIAGKIKSGTVWDAIHLLAAELMLAHKLGGRRLGNRALHSNTAANALHHAYANCQDSRIRYLTMLQALSWVTEFMLDERNRDALRPRDITSLSPVDLEGDARDTVSEIMSQLPPRIFLKEKDDRTGQDRAAELTFALAQTPIGQQEFLAAARQSLSRRLSINAHEMKYPIAMFEECTRVSNRWRPHLLAATSVFLQGSKSINNPAVERGAAALRT